MLEFQFLVGTLKTDVPEAPEPLRCRVSIPRRYAENGRDAPRSFDVDSFQFLVGTLQKLGSLQDFTNAYICFNSS